MVNCSKTEGIWIGALKNNKNKPFGIKWPNGPIKALGVLYTYDSKLLMAKKFIDNLDKIKKLLNLWSSRGLSLHGKVTTIKSLVIPKFVYVSSLIPTPKEVVKDLNRMLFNFQWNGKDKVTRLSVINEYEKGGLKMVDLEALIQSLRLAWIKRIFSRNGGTWKNYVLHLLDHLGGLFFFSCSYDMNDYSIPCQFYWELLQRWSDFRETFAN